MNNDINEILLSGMSSTTQLSEIRNLFDRVQERFEMLTDIGIAAEERKLRNHEFSFAKNQTFWAPPVQQSTPMLEQQHRLALKQ